MSKIANIIDRLEDVWQQLKGSSLVKAKDSPAEDDLEKKIREFQELLNLSIPITEVEKITAEVVRKMFSGHKGGFQNFLSISNQEYICLLTEGGLIAHMLGISHLVFIKMGDHGRYQVYPNDFYKETIPRKEAPAQPVRILKRTEEAPTKEEIPLENPPKKEESSSRFKQDRPRRRRSRRGGRGRSKKDNQTAGEETGLNELIKNIKNMKALPDDIPEAPRDPNKAFTWVEVAKKPPSPPKKEEKPVINKSADLSVSWADVSDSD